jgi:hypothetical protein
MLKAMDLDKQLYQEVLQFTRRRARQTRLLYFTRHKRAHRLVTDEILAAFGTQPPDEAAAPGQRAQGPSIVDFVIAPLYIHLMRYLPGFILSLFLSILYWFGILEIVFHRNVFDHIHKSTVSGYDASGLLARVLLDVGMPVVALTV